MATTITIWKDRDNAAKITLAKSGTTLTADEMAAITKVEIKYNGNYYNSDDHADMFDWTTYADDGQLVINAGTVDLGDNLATDRKAELIIYDASNPNGIVWAQFTMIIKQDAVVA